MLILIESIACNKLLLLSEYCHCMTLGIIPLYNYNYVMNKTILSFNEVSFIIPIGMHRTLVSPETDIWHSGVLSKPKNIKTLHYVLEQINWKEIILDFGVFGYGKFVFKLLLDTSEKKCWPFFGWRFVLASTKWNVLLWHLGI